MEVILKKKRPTARLLNAALVLMIMSGAAYALYLVNSLTQEMRRMSTRLETLENLSSVASDISTLAERVALLETAEKRLARMEAYMRHIPQMAQTSNKALEHSTAAARAMNDTNRGLAQANLMFAQTASRLGESCKEMAGMRAELAHMKEPLNFMAAQIPALGEMRDQLTKTSQDISRTASGLNSMNEDIDRMAAGFDDMRALLNSADSRLAVLPELKKSLDTTNTSITEAMLIARPLAQQMPVFISSLEQMEQTTQEMNRTTQEMADTLKQSPKQSAWGVSATDGCAVGEVKACFQFLSGRSGNL